MPVIPGNCAWILSSSTDPSGSTCTWWKQGFWDGSKLQFPSVNKKLQIYQRWKYLTRFASFLPTNKDEVLRHLGGRSNCLLFLKKYVQKHIEINVILCNHMYSYCWKPGVKISQQYISVTLKAKLDPNIAQRSENSDSQPLQSYKICNHTYMLYSRRYFSPSETNITEQNTSTEAQERTSFGQNWIFFRINGFIQ